MLGGSATGEARGRQHCGVCVLDGDRSTSKWHTVTVTLWGSVLGEARDRVELLKFEGLRSWDQNWGNVVNRKSKLVYGGESPALID